MWYYMQDGAQQGPISEEELRGMAQDGRLQPTDMVWKSGMQEWQQANQISVLPFSAPATPEVPAVPTAPSSGDVGTGSYGSSPAAGPASSYGTPSTYGGGAAGSAISDAEIPNYLPWSIVVTILCCLPGGIVSIVYATKANSAKQVGNFAEAQEAAKQAKTWIMVSVGIGLGFTLLYLLLVVFGAMAGNL